MSEQSEGASTLGARLRALRQQSRATQRTLAETLGVGAPSISGYETDTLVPPGPRLRGLATFFSVERARSERRLPTDDELTEDERTARDTLLRELSVLAGASPSEPADLWTFTAGEPVVIVVGQLENMSHPYNDERDPNYTDLLSHADLDALVELFGHVRMRNPSSVVRWVRADRFGASDHLAAHLVILGGPGLNERLEEILDRTPLPISQRAHPKVENGEVFYVDGLEAPLLPKFLGRTPRLTEDVGLFARMTSPFSPGRTLTWCSGTFSRGVYGAVRILTDQTESAFGERNGAYLADRFAAATRFAILVRVPVLLGRASTPDLQDDNARLYEWSDADDSGHPGEAQSHGDTGEAAAG